jgi:phosphate transport system permease protein
MNNVATMNAPATAAAERAPTDWSSAAMKARVRRRYMSEKIFRLLGFLSVSLSVLFLAFLLVNMMSKGLSGFRQTEVAVPVTLDSDSLMLTRAVLQGSGADQALAGADLEGAVISGATGAYGDAGVRYLSEGAWVRVRDDLRADPSLLDKTTVFWLPASSNLDLIAKGKIEDRIAPDAAAAYRELSAKDKVRTSFNWSFLTGADSTDPTLVGIWGAFKGSLLTMLVTLIICFPIGVLSAIYLEEYAAKNRWTDFIEVSINNLAAVPSIIFGLLGLAVFLNFMHMPRSAPIVGGLTLALMTLPVIVIAGRNAIKSVPPSIRDAALGIGASPVQVVFHHVLPLALPGILTGTIIGMARALGETAPLLMIGMRAFIAAPPSGFSQPATVLPVQIFLWSDEVSRGFVEKTSAAIIVLLVFLLTMNGLAIYLRNKFERRW